MTSAVFDACVSACADAAVESAEVSIKAVEIREGCNFMVSLSSYTSQAPAAGVRTRECRAGLEQI